MKSFAATALMFVTLGGAGPAGAQGLGNLQSYCLSNGGNNDCEYGSLAQCMAAASGQSGTCVESPFAASSNFSGANATATDRELAMHRSMLRRRSR